MATQKHNIKQIEEVVFSTAHGWVVFVYGVVFVALPWILDSLELYSADSSAASLMGLLLFGIFILGVVFLIGGVSLNPHKHAKVFKIGNQYLGTRYKPGLFFRSPFYKASDWDLSPRKLELNGLQVEDLSGSLLKFSGSIHYQVTSPAQAEFSGEKINEFVEKQTKLAISKIAGASTCDSSTAPEPFSTDLREQINHLIKAVGGEVTEVELKYFGPIPQFIRNDLKKKPKTSSVKEKSIVELDAALLFSVVLGLVIGPGLMVLAIWIFFNSLAANATIVQIFTTGICSAFFFWLGSYLVNRMRYTPEGQIVVVTEKGHYSHTNYVGGLHFLFPSDKETYWDMSLRDLNICELRLPNKAGVVLKVSVTVFYQVVNATAAEFCSEGFDNFVRRRAELVLENAVAELESDTSEDEALNVSQLQEQIDWLIKEVGGTVTDMSPVLVEAEQVIRS